MHEARLHAVVHLEVLEEPLSQLRVARQRLRGADHLLAQAEQLPIDAGSLADAAWNRSIIGIAQPPRLHVGRLGDLADAGNAAREDEGHGCSQSPKSSGCSPPAARNWR